MLMDMTNMTHPITGVHIEQRGDYFYLEHGYLRVRWDNLNSWFLTLQQSQTMANISSARGICGNNNADPYGKC